MIGLGVVSAAQDRAFEVANVLAESLVCGVLSRIQIGYIELLTDGSRRTFGDESAEEKLRATIRVTQPKFFWRVLKDADMGLAESYMAGEWETKDLVAFFRVMIANRNSKAISADDFVSAFVGRVVNNFQHYRRRNFLGQSRRNIEDHYDLSNDLFRIFLDPSMTYSSAIFRSDYETLEQGQRNKLSHIVQKAQITKSDHVLEIGCGWGSFAILAAQTTGCKVTCVTLSSRQLEEVVTRVKKLGLEDHIEVQLIDYRLVKGTFDKVVSIEMLEAVGYEFYGDYFATIDRLLKPDGLAVIQVITTPDANFEYYRRGCDFIQKHIFPGSLCPSLTCVINAMTKSSSLQIHHLENIGVHYARTLSMWRHNFLKREDDVRALGFDSVFIRKWDYYFAYCEGGFDARFLGDLQLVLTRPVNMSLPIYEDYTFPPTINPHPHPHPHALSDTGFRPVENGKANGQAPKVIDI
mmetsp:Transcript_18912/g.31033  ORF Transcript_18912/g.31033 Transcript_18912/m.31033 type:complete len:465 (+) Transcript_18912:126-1520(+)